MAYSVKQQWLLCLALMLFLMPTAGLCRLFIPIPLSEIAHDADVICVATCRQVHPQAIVKDSGGKIVRWSASSAEVDVEQVLKGTAPNRHITIHFNDQPPTSHWMDWDETTLVPGERAILFLSAAVRDNWTEASFVDDGIPGHQPKVDIGSTILRGSMTGLTPFQICLMYMAQSLPNISPQEHETVFYDFQEYGLLLIKLPTARQLRDKDRAEFLKFCRERLLSPVLKLRRDPDIDTRVGALCVAAVFQDVEVLPDLLAVANEQVPGTPTTVSVSTEAAQGIGNFHTAAAIPGLLRAYSSPSFRVQYNALQSLAPLLQRVALPLLVDHLGDTDSNMNDLVLYWLPQLAGDVGFHYASWDGHNAPHWVAYWKTWAAAHPLEISRLRRQLDKAYTHAAK